MNDIIFETMAALKSFWAAIKYQPAVVSLLAKQARPARAAAGIPIYLVALLLRIAGLLLAAPFYLTALLARGVGAVFLVVAGVVDRAFAVMIAPFDTLARAVLGLSPKDIHAIRSTASRNARGEPAGRLPPRG